MRDRMARAPLGSDGLLHLGALGHARLAWRLLRDPRVGSKLKVTVPVLAALYVVSPIDLLPDLLLGLGQIDDVGVVGLAVVFLSRVLPRLAPADVLKEHLAAMGYRTPTGRARGEPPATAGAIDAAFRVRE